MRLGVYGDSFADKAQKNNSWWNFLQTDFAHDVTCFGYAGSSILYSVDLLLSNHDKFDLNIWCLTCPGRFSVFVPEVGWFHSADHMNIQGQATRIGPIGYEALCKASANYLKYIFDHRLENVVGKSLVYYLQHTIPNLLIIPCFYPPLELPFNLYSVCEREVNTLLPDQPLHEIYQQYRDIRDCHLTRQNNRILAELVNQNLLPGVFQTTYERFVFTDLVISDLLEKRHDI